MDFRMSLRFLFYFIWILWNFTCIILILGGFSVILGGFWRDLRDLEVSREEGKEGRLLSRGKYTCHATPRKVSSQKYKGNTKEFHMICMNSFTKYKGNAKGIPWNQWSPLKFTEFQEKWRRNGYFWLSDILVNSWEPIIDRQVRWTAIRRHLGSSQWIDRLDGS